MNQFNSDVQPFINKQFDGTTQGEVRSMKNKNTLEVYDGNIIIRIFLGDNQEKFITSFGNFNLGTLFEDHTKTIKTINQTEHTNTIVGFLWNSYKKSYKLQIECTDSSVILLDSNYPFKIYNSYDDVHKNTPTDTIDLDHNY